MKKILVTGGAGNIGGALVSALINSGRYKVTVVDDLSTGSLSKIPTRETANFDFIKSNVNRLGEISPIMLSHQFDYVFHFAAVVGVERTQQNPVAVLNDIEGFKNILSLSKSSSVKRVFFSSSSEVYGEPVELPQHEHRTPLNSRVPYAVVKNVGECFFRSYYQEYGLSYTIFRFFNTYGPKQSTDFVISRFLAAALKNQPITIYGDGTQTRTFTYVDDTVETCIKCFESELVLNDVINIGSDKLITIKSLAELIIDITGSKSKITYLPPLKEGDMTRRQPDNQRMREILGRDLLPVEDGIKRMIADTDYLKSIGL